MVAAENYGEGTRGGDVTHSLPDNFIVAVHISAMYCEVSQIENTGFGEGFDPLSGP